MPLNTLDDCRQFLQTQSSPAIATQLRRDQAICRLGDGFPSLLVHCLPPSSSPAHYAIARALSDPSEKIPSAVARMRLAGIVQGIKAYLANMSHPDLGDATYAPGSIPSHISPSDDELKAALKVLQYLQLPLTSDLNITTPLGDIISTIEAQLSLGPSLRAAQHEFTAPVTSDAKRKRKERTRKCYMCFFILTSSHPLYPSLCRPCGDFNIASSDLSLPSRLNLESKFALVTGARINLGLHIALRLLRCGAHVLVTSRYPFDAEARYLDEPDASTWKHRLRIIGADFRTAKDVFSLIDSVKHCLYGWGTERLDILINNAAQTLTDRVDVEREKAAAEAHLRLQSSGELVVGDYIPRVRGGMNAIDYGAGRQALPLEDVSPTEQIDHQDGQNVMVQHTKSSWTQQLHEIPYEDVISAHSINAFVPLILIRELLPLMSSSRSSRSSIPTSSKPSAYIVNVSSREGIPESKPTSSAKAGHHVHTNMSKAALNMLTETEASEAWQKGRVAMNTVDPGYMSADPEWMEMLGRSDQRCPIGWEDGAARVLWPVALGEKGTLIWGRFLKHFQSVDLGRI